MALTLVSPDGDMGFPGALTVTTRYSFVYGSTLRMEMSATTDAPTLVNLAHHSYFNLEDGGSGDILDHRLMLAAAAYLPVDDQLIPTGVVQPVDGKAFDFRQARPIRHQTGGKQTLYDHNFCLAAQRGALKHAVWVQAPTSGVEMEVWTTEPGVQFYAGHKVSLEQEGLGGRRYKACAGFCLEPQVWPDSPNRPYSRKRCCGRARPTARRRSTGSGRGERRPQRLERRQRAAHLDHGRRHGMRLARGRCPPLPRRQAARRDRRR